MYGYFKRQTDEIGANKTETWLRKENLKEENKSLLIAAQSENR